MADRYEGRRSEIDSPATSAYIPTNSDTVDLPHTSRGLYVGSAGDVKVRMKSALPDQEGAADVTFTAVLAGSILPVRVSRVFATGTTAASLVVML